LPESRPDQEPSESGWVAIRDAAERLDSEPRLLALMRRLRRNLPGDEQFGDPLSSGGATAVGYLARGVAVVRPDRESVVSELGLAGLQLWQSLSERAGRGRGDLELALLYTDLVDFSNWALRAGDGATVAMLAVVGAQIEAAVTAHQGRIVKHLGDGVIATFVSPQGAVLAGLEIAEALAELDVEGSRPRIRAGVHWGRPRRLGGEYLGVDVTVAASVGEAARAGQLLVSTTALAGLDADALGLRIGRRKRLRAAGLPRELQVAIVRRAREKTR
jgi:adenylate cyclase